MSKIKIFFRKYGFYIASIVLFVDYIFFDDNKDSSNLVMAIMFFVMGASSMMKE